MSFAFLEKTSFYASVTNIRITDSCAGYSCLLLNMDSSYGLLRSEKMRRDVHFYAWFLSHCLAFLAIGLQSNAIGNPKHSNYFLFRLFTGCKEKKLNHHWCHWVRGDHSNSWALISTVHVATLFFALAFPNHRIYYTPHSSVVLPGARWTRWHEGIYWERFSWGGAPRGIQIMDAVWTWWLQWRTRWVDFINYK